MSKPIFSCSVPGRAGIKKNRTQRRFLPKQGRYVTMPSDAYIAWADFASVHVSQALAARDPIMIPLEANYRFYFKNRANEADVSNCVEGIADVMQKVGVFKDDRQIMRFTAEKFFGHEPRTEVDLYPFNETREGKEK